MLYLIRPDATEPVKYSGSNQFVFCWTRFIFATRSVALYWPVERKCLNHFHISFTSQTWKLQSVNASHSFFIFTVLMRSLTLCSRLKQKVTVTLQLICGPSLLVSSCCSGSSIHQSAAFQFAVHRADSALLLVSWRAGNNYRMSGGSTWLMDKAISVVFLSLLAQLTRRGGVTCRAEWFFFTTLE